MDTRFFHAFLVVSREGTFARAAEAMGVTQPAVSYQMSRLEEQLGEALFERAGRRLVLTASGRALRDFCARYFRELDALTSSFADGAPARGEPVRIASVSGFGRYVLFPLLTSEPFRDVRWDLTFRTAEEVFEAVEHGQVDLGVVYRPKVSSYLHVEDLRNEEIVLIASPELADELGPDPDLAQIQLLPFITYEESEYVFGHWFEALFGRQPHRLRGVHNFTELEEVITMTRLGRGASVVPLDSALAETETGSIRVIRPRGTPCVNKVYGVTRAGAFVRAEVTRILEILAQVEGDVVES